MELQRVEEASKDMTSARFANITTDQLGEATEYNSAQ